jgi:hypothetical protein
MGLESQYRRELDGGPCLPAKAIRSASAVRQDSADSQRFRVRLRAENAKRQALLKSYLQLSLWSLNRASADDLTSNATNFCYRPAGHSSCPTSPMGDKRELQESAMGRIPLAVLVLVWLFFR